jgi:glycosyltransferase involved in cell wall biosynthesis
MKLKLFFLIFLATTSYIFGNNRNHLNFVFIITAHNEQSTCKKTLNSIFDQTYTNYKIIYIDDGSTDNTKQIVLDFVKNNNKETQVQLLSFPEKKGSIERLFEATHTLEDDDIVIFFEGNCYLPSNNILEKIKHEYNTNNTWVVYGQHLNVTTNKKGRCKKVSSKNLFTNSMRYKAWVRPRIKSFYASLFKKIDLKKFFFRKSFYDEFFDQCYMFPILEMAGHHVSFIPDIICHYYEKKNEKEANRSCNRTTIRALRDIVSSKPYKHLDTIYTRYTSNQSSSYESDLLIFSYDRPMQLFSFLESVEKYITGLNNISVIYRSSDERFSTSYDDVKKTFPKVCFIKQSDNPSKDFQPLVMQYLFSNENQSSSYTLFAVDDIIVKDYIDISQCIYYMKKTGSYFFSLRLGKTIDYSYMAATSHDVPYHVNINKDVIGWTLNAARFDWMYDNSVDMTLYKKKDIEKSFKKISFHNPNELEINWNHYENLHSSREKKRRTGLCFNTTRVVNIPLNLVNISNNPNINSFSANDLLEKYEDNLKIDIMDLFQIENHSTHIDYEPKFIQR